MPYRSPTPCTTPGCPNLTRTTRCTPCQQQHNRKHNAARPELRTHRWQQTSRRIIERDAGICHICGQPGADTTDHLVPRTAGGTDDDTNLAACHRGCNARKSNR